MSDFWKDKKVMVTGSSGFIGSKLVAKLTGLGCELSLPRKKEYDLTSLEQTMACFQQYHPEIVIHLAAYYGGIKMNVIKAATIFFENIMIGTNVFEAARLTNVQKLIVVGTGCAYPGHIVGKMKEEQFWEGACHESVENYGAVKKMLLLQGKAYKKQYGLESIHVANVYGPGDTFNPDRSHAGGAMVRRFVEAQRSQVPSVTLWGTGQPIREFLFVDDAADGVLLASELYNDVSMPLNIGTSVGTSIKELAELAKSKTGYEGDVLWDTTKPDGAKEKVLDTTRMEAILHWRPKTSLSEGLQKTIEWYRKNKEFADSR